MTEVVIGHPLADEFEEANYDPAHKGPASKVICKVTRGNVCGSGAMVGRYAGKAVVLTNAHVIGSRPGTRGSFRFPELADRVVSGEIIVAAYSDRIYMDWAFCLLDTDLPLEPVKLDIRSPSEHTPHYTGGYPKCRGPYYQKIHLVQVINKGTVALWNPRSIGGQSGSAVHSSQTHLQQMLLTWLWNGYGAGQTIRSIYFQYVNQAAVGFEKSDEFIELGNKVDDLESGFFYQAMSLSDLAPHVFAHLGEDPDEPTDPTEPEPPTQPIDKQFAAKVKKIGQDLVDLADKQLEAGPAAPPTEDRDDDTIYGLR